VILTKREWSEVLKFERLQKIKEEKLNKEMLGIEAKHPLPDGRAAL